MNGFEYIKRNIDMTLSEMEEARIKANSAMPKLVAVTKSATDEELIALAELGVSAIGENRPGELARRGELLRRRGLFPELHEIGKLQSNKAKLVTPISTLIHSLDGHSLAKEINRLGLRDGRTIDVLVEINSGREAQKSGIMPEDAKDFIESLGMYESIRLRGLMTMGPATDNPEELRRYFALTRELFEKHRGDFAKGLDPILSMGMSDSFKVAIEEGSTLVRVGRRLFNKQQEV